LTLSEQLRAAIRASHISRFRLCEMIGLDEASMSRFLSRKGGLSMSTFDNLAEVLRLRLSVDDRIAAVLKPSPGEWNPINYRLRFVNKQFSQLVELPTEGITKSGEAAIRVGLQSGDTLCHYRISILWEPPSTAGRLHVRASTPDWVYKKFGLCRSAAK
jgi:transcriptional regulator with XRE-family HTH domain